jgi:hypothetical protein
VLRSLAPWTEHGEPGVRFFSGIAEYRAEFSLTDAWVPANRRAFLDLGRLWAVAEVEVNRRSFGVVWKEPLRVEITPAIREGRNELRVRIANTWANRLAGDARDPGGKRYGKTNITTTTADGIPWAKVDPIPSGLMGPVRLYAGESLGVLR